MNLNNIINSISRKFSSEEMTAAWYFMEENITPEIKKKFNISENAQAFVSGNRSVVFENQKGNIVAFLNPDSSRACEQAYKAVGRNSKVLPEIYDLEYINLKSFNSKVCVIEMEKLRPTTANEWEIIHVFVLEYRAGFTKEVIKRYREWQSSTEFVDTNFKKIADAVINLMEEMIKENISHKDLHGGNVAWDNDGNLKLIDWEEIILDWIYE